MRRGHGVVMVQRGRLGSRSSNHASLYGLGGIDLSFFMSSHDGACSAGVGGMVEEGTNVVDEKRI